jgi:hypothetical protein
MHGAKTLSGINFFHWDWYLTHSMSSSAVPSTTGFRPCPVHYKERFVSRIYALPPVSTKQPLDSQRGYLAGVCMSGSDRASPQHRLRLFCALSPVPIGPATHNFPSTAKRQNQMAGTAVLSSSCCKRINRHSFHSSLRYNPGDLWHLWLFSLFSLLQTHQSSFLLCKRMWTVKDWGPRLFSLTLRGEKNWSICNNKRQQNSYKWKSIWIVGQNSLGRVKARCYNQSIGEVREGPRPLIIFLVHWRSTMSRLGFQKKHWNGNIYD